MTESVPLIYASHYNISAFGLEHLHPFDGQKYSKIRKHLIRAGLRTPADFVKPLELSKEQLLKVHTAEYLESLKDSGVLAKIFEVFAASVIPSQESTFPLLRRFLGSLLAESLRDSGRM